MQRKPNRHIAFGTGIHFCLGHQLARIEGRCALKSLFRRWPDLALAVDPSEITWRKRPGFKAIDRLPVQIAGRSPPELPLGSRVWSYSLCGLPRQRISFNNGGISATIVAPSQHFRGI